MNIYLLVIEEKQTTNFVLLQNCYISAVIKNLYLAALDYKNRWKTERVLKLETKLDVIIIVLLIIYRLSQL